MTMKHLLLSALAIVALSTPALAEERQVEIAVSELTCPSCSFIVASCRCALIKENRG